MHSITCTKTKNIKHLKHSTYLRATLSVNQRHQRLALQDVNKAENIEVFNTTTQNHKMTKSTTTMHVKQVANTTYNATYTLPSMTVPMASDKTHNTQQEQATPPIHSNSHVIHNASKHNFKISTRQELSTLFQNTSSAKPPVLVSIDFEGPGKIINGFDTSHCNSQTGLCILDLADLTLRSTNFICGTDNYYTENISRCRLGAVERINKADMLSKITNFIPRNREIILIGHSTGTEIDCLRTLGFDFMNVKTFFDTHELAMDFHLGNIKLCQLIAKLPGQHNYDQGVFHTAVNDAVVTLQCFLELYLMETQTTTEVNTSMMLHLSIMKISRSVISKQQGATTLQSDTTTYVSREQRPAMYIIPPYERLSQFRSRSSSAYSSRSSSPHSRAAVTLQTNPPQAHQSQQQKTREQHAFEYEELFRQTNAARELKEKQDEANLKALYQQCLNQPPHLYMQSMATQFSGYGYLYPQYSC
jgi:hypothetical protein